MRPLKGQFGRKVGEGRRLGAAGALAQWNIDARAFAASAVDRVSPGPFLLKL